MVDVHSEYGTTKGEGALANTTFVNAAICNEQYAKEHEAQVIDIEI